jgi:hypothetical protein
VKHKLIEASWVLVAILVAGLYTTAMVKVVNAEDQKRFEHVYTSQGIDYGINGFHRTKVFVVFHDKETGQEIVCVDSLEFGAESCYLTGRKW